MENKYTVKLLPRAYRDLDSIYVYLAETLLEPVIAVKLVDSLEEAIFSLESMPRRNALRKTLGAGYLMKWKGHVCHVELERLYE